MSGILHRITERVSNAYCTHWRHVLLTPRWQNLQIFNKFDETCLLKTRARREQINFDSTGFYACILNDIFFFFGRTKLMAPICVHITHIMGYLIKYLFAQYTGLLSVSVHTGELNSSRGNKIWIYEWVYLCVCVYACVGCVFRFLPAWLKPVNWAG